MEAPAHLLGRNPRPRGRHRQYIAVARRHGDDWYVGTIRPDGKGELDVPLAFLRPGVKYTATIFSDRDVDNPDSKAVKIETLPVDSTTVLKARMPANGGQAIRIVPAGA